MSSRRSESCAVSNGDSADSSWTKSPRLESSSSPIGFSSETGSCAMRRISRTSSVVISSSSAISSGVRLAAEALHELALDVHDLVQLLDHVHGDADRARLVGDRARDRLADPPRRVRRELVALAVVELLDRADQAERALLDQVEEARARARGSPSRSRRRGGGSPRSSASSPSCRRARCASRG